MKTLVLLVPLLAVALAYSDMNDNFVLDTLLSNKEKVKKETRELTACLLDEGPCEGFNAAVKLHAIQSMTDGCAECDVIQKRGAIKCLKTLKNDFPDQWEKFEKKYDPDRTKYDNVIKILNVYD